MPRLVSRLLGIAALAAGAALLVVALLATPGHRRRHGVLLASRTLPALAAPRARAAPPHERAARRLDALAHTRAFVSVAGDRRREVALTFDDGPGPYTPLVLRALRRLHVPATFFEVGQMIRAFPRIAREVGHSGLPIGDHTFDHPALTALSPARQLAEIAGQAAAMRTVGDRPPQLFRPPYGLFDATTEAILRRLSLVNVVWTLDSKDYTRPGVAWIVRNVIGGIRPGAIVLMHDGGGDRSETVAALPALVHDLRMRGYRLVTVPRLLLDDPPPRHQRFPATPPGAPGGDPAFRHAEVP